MNRVLIGRGGHGKDIRHAFPKLFDEWWPTHEDAIKWTDEGPYILGINDSQTRYAVAQAMDAAGWVPYSFKLEQGPGVVVMPCAHVGPEVTLGQHTHINFNAGLTRCRLGKFVTVGPGATICGDVTVGDRTMIGAGAVIRNLVNIGSDVTVGAGAVVIGDVQDGQTVIGVPARPPMRKAWEDRAPLPRYSA